MSKIVATLLLGGLFLCSADSALVTCGGVLMLAAGMVLGEKWRL